MKQRITGFVFIVAGLVLMLSLLSGCAGNLRQSAHLAVAADGVTTATAIATGLGREANPLTPTPAGIAASLALRFGLIEYINTQPEPGRTKGLAGINAVTWGVSASNAAVLIAHSNPVGLAVAGISGYLIWKSTEDERTFAVMCANERLLNPSLTCKYKS